MVAKLFNMVGPDVAYFGQKDAQQALVIRKLARDLDIPVRIEVCPTVRDADGLAFSSRNAYLSAEERERALGLSRALRAAEERVAAGDHGRRGVLAAARAELDAPGSTPSTSSCAPPGTFRGRAGQRFDAAGRGRARGPGAADRQRDPGRRR